MHTLRVAIIIKNFLPTVGFEVWAVIKFLTDRLEVMVCTGLWGCVEKGRILKGNTPRWMLEVISI